MHLSKIETAKQGLETAGLLSVNEINFLNQWPTENSKYLHLSPILKS